MKSKLIIITPTFNRMHTLRKCFESLKEQTNKNFKWLVIDDGSKDDTELLMKEIIRQSNLFDVIYKKKENGGKHTALNYAYDFIDDEFILILDSDDFLTPDAVEFIYGKIEKYENDENICCISCLRKYTSGNIIGKEYLFDEYISDHIKCRVNQNIYGDKAEIFRGKILKNNKFPYFKGENFIGEDVIWTKLGYDYKTVYINYPIYVCEYLEGGLTKSGRKMRVNSPKGGMERSLVYFNDKVKLSVKIKMMLLYIVYYLFSNEKEKKYFHRLKVYKFLYVILYPIGYFIWLYWSILYENKKL